MNLFSDEPNRKNIAGHLIWFSAWLAAVFLGIYLSPDPSGHGTHTQLGLPPCPSIFAFGRPCPGCGLTTSFSAIMHADWNSAISSHPFGIPVFLIWTFSALFCGYGWINSKRFHFDGRAINLGLLIFVIVFFGYGVMRFSSTHVSVDQRFAPYLQKNNAQKR